MKLKIPRQIEISQPIPELPATAMLVADRNDKGKKVIINSISGALINAPGIVIAGPYTFSYRRNKEDKGIKKKGPIVNSEMYWQVLVNDLYISFVEQEIIFLKK